MGGYNWSNYRNYEMSVWTLQDNYITTLKSADPLTIISENEDSLPARAWSQARAESQIQNGEMTINIDGTQSLTFDVPMYIYHDGVREENPNWYNTVSSLDELYKENYNKDITKQILTSMRKIKVIFNKWENSANNDEFVTDQWNSSSVFEFMITKVQETHEHNELMCHVECEGLAFHELGKVGYKRSLSAEEFNEEYYNWAILTPSERAEKHIVEPINNIDYWLKKAKIEKAPTISQNGLKIIDIDNINPNKWYYQVRMAHSSLVHQNTSYDEKIYEEGYPTSWGDDETPINYMETREKLRLVDISESNLYNITQDLAEKFEVFCKYEYLYDNNYNIIGRIIVFYNNFLQEGKDVVTLMYPNSANKISREMDSTDVSTKMFVRSVEDSTVYNGIINIMDCDANYMQEDYLLNFDYLHDIGTITDEQYNYIPEYKNKIRELNKEIVPLQGAYNKLSDKKKDVKARIKVLEESIKYSKERITENVAKINAIDETDGVHDGYITRDWRNPEIMTLLKNSSNSNYDTYYVQFNNNSKNSGIVGETVKLYASYNTLSTKTMSYAVSFRQLSKDTLKKKVVDNNNSKLAISLPGKDDSTSCTWRDYPLVYKGTIGYIGTVKTLPTGNDVSEKDAYRVLGNGMVKAYANRKHWEQQYAAVDKWLCYVEYEPYDGLCRWEIKDSEPNEYINKGKVGKEGTAGITATSLPKKPKVGDAYQVKTANYVKGYVETNNYRYQTTYATENQWVCYVKYDPTNNYMRWEIKDGSSSTGNNGEVTYTAPSGFTDKGTIGQNPSTGELPTISNRQQGWFYKSIYGKKYTANDGPNTKIEKGGLVIFNGESWEVFNPPPKKQSVPDGAKVAHELGFYLYTRQRIREVCGPEVEVINVQRLGATKSNPNDYIARARYLYYTYATGEDLPVLPTIESSTTSETEIVNYNVMNKWSSYLSVPDTPVDDDPKLTNYSYLDNYNFRCVMELQYAQGKKEFVNTNDQPDSATPTQFYNDVMGDTIKSKVQTASNYYLSDELEGEFKYDADGNLDKITGLFKQAKSGSYYTYGFSKPIKSLHSKATTVTDVDNAVAILKSKSEAKEMPAEKKNKYLIIHNTVYWTNGNVTHSYSLKYYNADGLEAKPADQDQHRYVNAIIPIFYLKTNKKKVPTPGDGTNNTQKVVNDKVENQWTTSLPDKTKDSQTYYRGWKVIYYGPYVPKYFGVKKANHLKKKPKMKTSDTTNTTSIPQYVYATYKYKPSLYYEKIKASYEKKLYADSQELEIKKEYLTRIEELLKTVDTTLQTAYDKKDALIMKFENIMGAALRESYWQPEDEYQDYGTRYNETLQLWWKNSNYNDLTYADKILSRDTDVVAVNNLDNMDFASIGWGDFKDDDEEKLYYESSINQTKVYYTCIDLSELTNNGNTFFELYRSWLASRDDNTNPAYALEEVDFDTIYDTQNYAPFTVSYETENVENDDGTLTTQQVEIDSDDAWVDQNTGVSISPVDSGEKVVNQEFFAFFFNPTDETIPSGGNKNDIRYCQYYSIGSSAIFAFIQTSTGEIKPILMLKDADGLTETELGYLKRNGQLGKVYMSEEDEVTSNSEKHQIILSYDSDYLFPVAGHYISEQVLETSKLVYPRILVPSLKMKNNSDDLVVKHNDTKLEPYEDYYVFVHSFYETKIGKPAEGNSYVTPTSGSVFSYYKNLDELTLNELASTSQYNTVYAITIKPDYIFRTIHLEDIYQNSSTQLSVKTPFNIFFMLSNADVDIYLDAKKIMKENAYPKVSYEINVNLWSRELLKNLHTKLAQLVMINDFDLKFQNTFGYISQITLNLDHEEQDQIEVKNYKTKFEDLFSSIVAETEEMHKNSHNIGLAGALAAGGSISAPLSTESFDTTLHDQSNQQILLNFLSEYFDGPEVIQKTAKELFEEAGIILNQAAASLDGTVHLTSENAGILAGFKENVVAAMTPKVFTGDTPPSSFKAGDVWINGDYRAVATAGSAVNGGFTRTFDGTLAEIKGANIAFDATTGVVDIMGQTQINMKSGKTIYIAANDTVDIVGNKAVNIGGTTINMASAHILGEGFEGNNGPGGLHLVSTEYEYVEGDVDDEPGSLSENSTSRVDIHGDGIEMASKKGIIIKSGEGIKIYASNQDPQAHTDDDHGTAAVKINSEEGIWLGSNKPLRLYSGNVIVDDEGNYISADDSQYEAVGANIELNSKHVLLGMANLSGSVSATALEMTDKQVIIAAGTELNQLTKDENGNYNLDELTKTNISGVQIKADYIGMATGNGVNRSLLSLKPGKVLIGQATYVRPSGIVEDSTEDNEARENYQNYTGSYIWLENSMIYIGGMGDLTINTNNIKIQTKLFDGDGTAQDPRAANSTEIAETSQMGFVLGKNLQGSQTDSDASKRPKPAFGFWIDNTDEPHLVIDTNYLRLGRGGIIDSVALSSEAAEEVITLYKVTASDTITPDPPIDNNDTITIDSTSRTKVSTWGSINYASIEDYNQSGWSKAVPNIPMDQGDNDNAEKHVWRVSEVRYANPLYDQSNPTAHPTKYRCTAPIYEGLTSNFNNRVVREYKYAQSTPAADSSGWTEALPTKPEADTESAYYYGDIAVTVDSTNIISPPTTIYDGMAVDRWSARSINGVGKIEILPFLNENDATTKAIAALGNNATEAQKNEWINNQKREITVTAGKQYYALATVANEDGKPGFVIITSSISHHQADDQHLYSRRHTYRVSKRSVYDDVRLESELESMSGAALNAWKIATGEYPVPSVSSSGLVIEGDNVILGSTGKLFMLGNAQVMMGTSSSNSAILMDKTGIAIGSGADIGIAAGSKIELYAGVKGDTSNIVLAPGYIHMGTSELTINANKLKITSGNTEEDFATYSLSMIASTVRVYRRYDSTTAPSLPSNQPLASQSTDWKANPADLASLGEVNVESGTDNYKYLFSTLMHQLKNGDYVYPGPVIYEGEYANIKGKKHKEYIRTIEYSSTSTKPSATTPDGNTSGTWSEIIPSSTTTDTTYYKLTVLYSDTKKAAIVKYGINDPEESVVNSTSDLPLEPTENYCYKIGTNGTYQGLNLTAGDYIAYCKPKNQSKGWYRVKNAVSWTETKANFPWVWSCDAWIDETSGSLIRNNISREQSIEQYTGAEINAVNIANGSYIVPTVSSSGLTINGNYVALTSTGELQVLAGGSIMIGNSTSNSAILINKDGIAIASGADIAIAADGHFTVDTPNFVVHSKATSVASGATPTDANVLFRVSNGDTGSNQIDYLKVIKTGSKTCTVSLGPWYVSKTYIGNAASITECNVGMRYKSSSNTAAAFFAGAQGSGTETENMKSAAFRVLNNGRVYMNKLMIKDKRTRTSTSDNWGSWGINGTHIDTELSNDELTEYGYVEIDFSGINFTDAVSISGSWSGSVFNAKATLWGKISKTVGLSASFDATSAQIGSRITGTVYNLSVTVQCTIGGSQKSSTVEGLTVDCVSAYNAGWNACRTAFGEVYTRSDGVVVNGEWKYTTTLKTVNAL